MAVTIRLVVNIIRCVAQVARLSMNFTVAFIQDYGAFYSSPLIPARNQRIGSGSDCWVLWDVGLIWEISDSPPSLGLTLGLCALAITKIAQVEKRQ